MTRYEITFLTFGLMCGLAFGLLIGVCWKNEEVQDEAVRAGAAEYYIGTNFAKEFRWKAPL
jgi:hypothetical protein